MGIIINYNTPRIRNPVDEMKKAAHTKRSKSPLKRTLEEDGRKLMWLSKSAGINYQRLQRITNQGYEPTISEAARICNSLKRPLLDLFPSLDLSNALRGNEGESGKIPSRGQSKGPG